MLNKGTLIDFGKKVYAGSSNDAYTELLFMWITAIMAIAIQPLLRTYELSALLSIVLVVLSACSFTAIFTYKKHAKLSFYSVLFGFALTLILARFIYVSKNGGSPINAMAELFFCIFVIYRFGIKSSWWVPLTYILIAYLRLYAYEAGNFSHWVVDDPNAIRMLLFFLFVGAFLFLFTGIFSLKLGTLSTRLTNTTERYKTTLSLLEEENEQLENAFQAIKKISSHNSHEIRRPVARILAIIQMYEDMGKDEQLTNELMSIDMRMEIKKALAELSSEFKRFSAVTQSNT